MTDLTGKKIAFLLTNGVEQAELTEPWAAVKNAGAQPVLISPESGSITAMKNDWDHADSFDVDVELSSANAADYDALVLPGGTVNADQMRTEEKAQAFLKDVFSAGKPVAAICHAPWILVDTELAQGRTLTSYFSLAPDLTNAGANWVDKEVVVDGNLITSRNPGDLDAFSDALIEKVAAH